MKHILTIMAALAAAALVAATALAGTSSRAHARASGALVTLRKTALGSVLVDARGRTLYLFEKDHNGLSMCSSACVDGSNPGPGSSTSTRMQSGN